MIYVTGDTHRTLDLDKLYFQKFAGRRKLTKKDFLIIAGDFGGVWTGDTRDNRVLELYNTLSYTVLFVDGNHENFDALNKYPIERWNGGKIHRIRENLIHLMRGQVFDIDNKSIFVFGGGVSIDKAFRVPGESWWPQENPTDEQCDEGLKNLAAHDNKVDIVITHACPRSIFLKELCTRYPMQKIDCPTENYLDKVLMRIEFNKWYFGHYHVDLDLPEQKMQALYNRVIRA